MVMMEKVADQGFLAFLSFENEWKFRKSVKLPQKIWNLAKLNITLPDPLGYVIVFFVSCLPFDFEYINNN